MTIQIFQLEHYIASYQKEEVQYIILHKIIILHKDKALPSNSSHVAQQMAPQSCTRETKGLLYFDLKMAWMFRCNGLSWERWGHNQLHNRMFKTAPVASGPSDTTSPAREAPRKPRDTCEAGAYRQQLGVEA